ncbi:MAG TPA: hypothetical protein VG755_16955, partial [Nannocystaceae bacterium]|nr:hypothetical protein [Nannocystaceae bacterium]
MTPAWIICAALGLAAPVEIEIEDEEPQVPTPAPSPAPTITTPSPTREYDGVEEIESTPAEMPEPVVPPATAMDPAVAAELASMRARIEVLEAERKTKPRAPTLRGDRGGDLPFTSIGFGRSLGVERWGVRFSGYIQAQYQSNQLSEDQLQQG